MVAAYNFDEGSGATVRDASGNGNTGTISGATWTSSGKFGNALVFDGVRARVSVPDATSLHLTTGMTLEAWVNPATLPHAARDVIYKGNDTYYLEASSSKKSRSPAGGAIIRRNVVESSPTSTLTPNTFTHLAVTYDGTTLRLFLNGVQVAAKVARGNIATSERPLEIGSDSIYGQYFDGTIDEVRVYNTALTAEDIQRDMNSPVGQGTGPEPTPSPTPTSPLPGGKKRPELSRVTATPRNVRSDGTVSFRLSRPATVSVDIRNASGIAVDSILESGHVWPGATTLRWRLPGDRPPIGIYLITVTATDGMGHETRAGTPVRIGRTPCTDGRTVGGWQYGTSTDDCLVGTSLQRRFSGLSGSDVIRVGAGHQLVLAGPGSDFVYGGPGNDVLRGGRGHDVCFAELGHDTVVECEVVHGNAFTRVVP